MSFRLETRLAVFDSKQSTPGDHARPVKTVRAPARHCQAYRLARRQIHSDGVKFSATPLMQ